MGLRKSESPILRSEKVHRTTFKRDSTIQGEEKTERETGREKGGGTELTV